MNDKFKSKKTCRVCFLPIIFKKDAHWEPAPGKQYDYPLNIHSDMCIDVVRHNGWNVFKVSSREVNNITKQDSLF